MSKELTRFDFSGNSVRVHIDEKGEPWFVAKDVCECLGIANARDAISRLDESQTDGVGITDAIGRDQQVRTVSESGVYELTLTSRRPEAVAFKKWIVSEVLPSIRKTGSYGAPKVETFEQRCLGVMQELIARVDSQAKQLSEAAPKVAFVERYVESKGLVGLQQIGRMLGHGPNKLIAQMQDDGVLFRQGSVLVPKAEHIERGRFEVKTLVDGTGRARLQTYATPSGIEWLAGKYGRTYGTEGDDSKPVEFDRIRIAVTRRNVLPS